MLQLIDAINTQASFTDFIRRLDQEEKIKEINTCEHCGEHEPEALRSWEGFYGDTVEGCESCYQDYS